MCCPTCGQQLPADRGFIFDEDAGVVVANGLAAMLPPKQAAALACLCHAAPGWVGKEQLYRALYTADEADVLMNTIESYVCKLRLALKPMGISIESLRFVGYRLVVPSQRKAA